MAKSQTVLNNEIKAHYLKRIQVLLEGLGEDVMQVKSNELAFPVLDSEGNEKSVVITVKVPTGAKNGTEPYDPYAMRDEYEFKLREKAEKVAKSEKAKAEKIARDQKRREAQAKINAKKGV
jgi:hypothetical protein